MPALFYGRGAYRRTNGNLPELRLINLFLEQTPADETGVILQCRRGLEEHAARGNGPIRGIFSQEGAFSGAIFTVSGTTVYKDGTSLGTINGSGPVRWAASATELLVTRGQSLYSYDGATLSAETFPDTASVRSVAYINSQFIAIRDATHKAYFRLTDTAWDALDFFSAESEPDNLLDVIATKDNVYFLGQGTIEVWVPSAGDPPFTRISNRLFPIGVIGTGCAVDLDNTVFLIGSDGILYRLGDVPERLSDHALEERIAASTTRSMFRFDYEGHKFCCIRLDDATFAYDVATGQICEFATYNETNWRAQCAINVGTTAYFGDDTDGTVWTFGDTFQDDGSALEAYFTAALPINGGTVSFDSVEVRANVGWTEPLDGDDASPVIEMRQSRDAGATFGNWREASLGGQGNYRTRAVFRRCGLFDSPGALFEFRITDQSPRRISGVFFNEPGGGRSR